MLTMTRDTILKVIKVTKLNITPEVEQLQKRIRYMVHNDREELNKRLFEIVPTLDNALVVLTYIAETKPYQHLLSGRRTLVQRAKRILSKEVLE